MAFGNGYGGYGGYGVSPYGPLGGSLPPASGMYPGMYPGAPGQDEFVGSGAKPKKKGIEGFFQGIYNGAANTIKGLFTGPGMAMAAASAGLVWATGGAALIPLAVIGAGVGGFQMLKGIGQGDIEGVGEGVFTTAASLLGLKYTPRNVNLNGKTFTLGDPNQKLGIMGRIKSMWGKEKYQSDSSGEVLHMGQMFRDKIQSRFPNKNSVTESNLRRRNTESIAGESISSNDRMNAWIDDTASTSSSSNASFKSFSSDGSPQTFFDTVENQPGFLRRTLGWFTGS